MRILVVLTVRRRGSKMEGGMNKKKYKTRLLRTP